MTYFKQIETKKDWQEKKKEKKEKTTTITDISDTSVNTGFRRNNNVIIISFVKTH